MKTPKTIPIIGKNTLTYAKMQQQKILENLSFKRLYLTVRQDFPWKATLVVDLTSNLKTPDQQVSTDYTYYLGAMGKLTEILISNKKVFSQLYSKWLSELGHQPDRLRIIYGKDQDFMEYNIKLSLMEKERVLIQIS